MDVDEDNIANVTENTIKGDEKIIDVIYNSKKKKDMSKRWVWSHFKTLPLTSINILWKKCKYCCQIYQNKYDNQTYTFTQYYSKCVVNDTCNIKWDVY